MGRILLAALDDDQLQDYLAHAELQPKTSRTLHTPEAVSYTHLDVYKRQA